MNVVDLISLISALFSVILSGIAIVLALYFYSKSHELHETVTSLLSRIEASTRATELASKDVLAPVINTILGLVRQTSQSQIETLMKMFIYRTWPSIERVTSAQTETEKKEASENIIKALNSLSGTLKDEIQKSMSPISWEGLETLTNHIEKPPLPGSPEYDWLPFVRRIRDFESKYPFLSVKWLRETVFQDEPQTQHALQAALDSSILETYHQRNPKNPAFPTLCCRLNRNQQIVKNILMAIGDI